MYRLHANFHVCLFCDTALQPEEKAKKKKKNKNKKKMKNMATL